MNANLLIDGLLQFAPEDIRENVSETRKLQKQAAKICMEISSKNHLLERLFHTYDDARRRRNGHLDHEPLENDQI